jgi:CHAD domain-containing protein
MSAQSGKPVAYKEVERKFDTDESTVSPSFDGLSAVARVERLPTQPLDAVYFDTPGYDLARNKITLRRRTGGLDEGWHLKLPAGKDARTEVRMPLTDSDSVPAELKDVVLAIVRDRPLAPVARICSKRDVHMLYGPDGTAVAEFCDDHVTASAGDGDEQHWREWELELVGNEDPDLLTRLSNRLLDAGGVRAGHVAKLGRVLETAMGGTPKKPEPASDDPIRRAVAEQVAELIQWDRAVRADTYDSVHQMRVTTRKLRSLLKGSEEAFGLTDDSWILNELREFAAILGVARDAEVLADKYEKALDVMPADLIRGPVRKRLVDGARRRYDAGLRRSVAAMRTTRYFRMLDALEELVAAEPPPTAHGEEAAPATLDAAYKKVRKAAKQAHVVEAEAAGSAESDEALHRIRKGAKRLRYTAAATGHAAVSEAAKAIQSLLGDHQDSVVSRVHLGEQAEAAHTAGEDTFTYGVLFQREDELASASREQVDSTLKALAKAVKKAR